MRLRDVFTSAWTPTTWIAVVGALCVASWEVAEREARGSLPPRVRASWFVASVFAALVGGVLAFPRWQALLALFVAVVAIVVLVR